MEIDLRPSSRSTGVLKDQVMRLWNHSIALIDRPIPSPLLVHPEEARRARLMTRFGILGCFFGLAYACFYLCIGHWWGAAIVLGCTGGVGISPFWMRWKGTIEPAANFFAMILTCGFVGLCCVEGGVHGHAIAWLVSVPLCALILAGTRLAIKWVIIVFLAAGFIVALDLAGIDLPVTYDAQWNSWVTAAGYLGLVVFMSLLGFIFEHGRASAFARMEEALAQVAASNGRLLELNKEKNEFLGIAAHDLKNPLTVILGNGQMLKELDDESQLGRNLAGMIVSAAERMRHLITNLLDINAIEEGKFASNLECCNLGELVESSVEHNSSEASRKQIEIRTGISDIYVEADREALMQVLDNVISNAIKYSPLNSMVHIHLLLEEKTALVRVRDEGPGISQQDQLRLFQKFSRLSARPTGGESSNGLGLAIVKKLVEAMGGEVACMSTPGCGATFTVRLGLWTDGISQKKNLPHSREHPARIAAFVYMPPNFGG